MLLRNLLLGCALVLAAGTISKAETIRVPSEVGTIEQAVQLAASGDTILVAPGEYQVVETDITTTGLTIRSEEFREAILFATGFPTFEVWASDFALEDFTVYVFGVSDMLAGIKASAMRTRIERCYIWGGTGFVLAVGDEGYFTVFRGNTVLEVGTAIESAGRACLIENNLIRRCSIRAALVYKGSGIPTHDAVVRGNTFRGNYGGSDYGGPGWGGALAILEGTDVLIEDNVFEDNFCDGWKAEYGEGLGGGLGLAYSQAVVIRRNKFIANQALRGGGLGAVQSSVEIRDNLFVANMDSAQFPENPLRGRGGALYLEECNGLVEGNTMVDNVALIDGSAVHMLNSTVAFRNNLIAHNRGDGGGVTTEDGAPPTWSCNNVWNSGSTNYSGWPDPTGLEGNISLDPLFCDPDALVYTLMAGSPCLPQNSDGCGLIGCLPIGCPVAGTPDPVAEAQIAIRAYPNPAVDHVWFATSGSTTSFRIYDTAGRLVRILDSASSAGRTGSLLWDLRDASGSLVASGTYWAVSEGSQSRIVVLRR